MIENTLRSMYTALIRASKRLRRIFWSYEDSARHAFENEASHADSRLFGKLSRLPNGKYEDPFVEGQFRKKLADDIAKAEKSFDDHIV